MNSRFRFLLVAVAALALLSVAMPTARAQQGVKTTNNFSDNLKHPLGAKQQALREKALEAQMRGERVGDVYEAAPGQFVETVKAKKDRIWTVIAEFGNQVNDTYGGDAGPQHNQIPQPDRSIDNTTIWTPDFSEEYFTKLLYSQEPGVVSMSNFYRELSQGVYTVNGDVTDWVKLDFNEANYGSDYCGDIVCARTWLFVNDSVDRWYDNRLNGGKTKAELNAILAQYDVWDRYDYDGDGNFNEPDGYIDHFQAVHAGQGEETGGGAQGTDAIWSHRWYAFYNNIGSDGPSYNPAGGVQIGDSDYWIGDYTVEPENGGVGVFSHEFGHDLGLPDLYDTSGNTGGAENSTGFWTLYSSGSYGNSGKPKDGLGTKPIHMSAYEKLFLGWSNYQVVGYGNDASVTLGPSVNPKGNVQTLIIPLPDKEVSTDLGAPYAGSYFYYSGSGNDLDNIMTREVTLPQEGASLSAKIRYDIEEGWDYGYVSVNGNPVHTNLSTNDDPNGQNFGEGITGSSGGEWVDLTADLSAYAGQKVTIGFRYWTDGATVENGIALDEIAISGKDTDGAESESSDWTFDGWTRTTGSVNTAYSNAYFLEYRTYDGYDKSLKTGPYNFGFLDNPDLQNWVEHLPYQDGLLVWYYDTSFADNNVGDHCADGRCGGLYLPVDAHPKLRLRPDGTVWRPRIQSFDSTFGLQPTTKLCLHQNSQEKCYKSLKARTKFDDTKDYWFPPDASINNNGWASVPLPKTGTVVRVQTQEPDSMQVQVEFKQP